MEEMQKDDEVEVVHASSNVKEDATLDPYADEEYETQVANAFSVLQTLKSCEEFNRLHLEVGSFYRLFGFVLWTCLTISSLLLGSERMIDAILGIGNNLNEPRWLQFGCAALELLGGAVVAVSSRYSPDARKTEHRSLASQYFALSQDLSGELKLGNTAMSQAKIKRLAGYDKRYTALLKQSFDSTNYALFLTATEKRLTNMRATEEYRMRQCRHNDALKGPTKLFSFQGIKQRLGLDSRAKNQTTRRSEDEEESPV